MRRLAPLGLVLALGCGDRGAPAPPAATAATAAPPATLDAGPPPVDARLPDVAAAIVAPVAALDPPCPKVTPRPPPLIDRMRLAAARWTDLPAWADDHHAEAAAALARSCDKLATLPDGAWIGLDHRFGRARQWRAACATRAAAGRSTRSSCRPGRACR